MGVPKFYRWISERYPCLSEVVKEFQIPEFDNLYLDMNGIIHVCSHPDDNNPHFRITEEKIFADIFHYIEFLFRMIKPRKVFFMAVDGVAPRAKMNQQRGRRFRSAREAENLIKEAEARGEKLPTEKRFDSNCITPGTEFMVRLQEQLQHFVATKVSSDPLWQGPEVFLSGHETPGEGEHKIMEYIRYVKSQPDYDNNTRHCLYGLDADLIMLGLVSHEPHFSLLREEVRFGGKKDKNKRPPTPEETTFHLLHLSLLREYIDYEFSELRGKLKFEYNVECIIDDWILMGFLVGNDFIPHLPHLHIHHDALPMLWRTYKEVLPSLDGYLNTGGHLHLERFEKYLNVLARFDKDTFENETYVDLKYWDSKTGKKRTVSSGLTNADRRKNKGKSTKSQLPGNQFSALVDSNLEPDDDMEEDEDVYQTPDEDFTETDDDEDLMNWEFQRHKDEYYMNKLSYKSVTKEVMEEQAEGYVLAIQWILLYYFEGVPSWSWYYPHHYAPYISDVKNFSDMKIQFQLGRPFLPFQQLMAVLPAASKELLPPAYRDLMTEESSPVIDFYPVDFQSDLNGKQQEWEAVVLIPFIDEKRLLGAMASKEGRLTSVERERNRHGPCLVYQYTPDMQPPLPTTLPTLFSDLNANYARRWEIPLDGFDVPSGRHVKGLLPSVMLDVHFPGFPTFKHIKHSTYLKKAGVKVFQMNSRNESMMLKITVDGANETLDAVATRLLGNTTFVGWPHLQEAQVIAVSDGVKRIELDETASSKKSSRAAVPRVVKTMTDSDAMQFQAEVTSIKQRYHDRLAVEVGQTDILLYCCTMTGRRYVCGSHSQITLEKQFSTLPEPFALQVTVKDIDSFDSGFSQFRTLEELFPKGSPVFMLGLPHYGCQGSVLEVDKEHARVRVAFCVPEEPCLSDTAAHGGVGPTRYMPGHVLAQRLGVSTHFVSRITGTIYILRRTNTGGQAKINIGLNMKFTKRKQELPGYTKRTDDGWSYSEKALDTIGLYLRRFPQVAETMTKLGTQGDMFAAEDIFRENVEENLAKLQEFLQGLPCSSVTPMEVGSDILDESEVQCIEQAVNHLKQGGKLKKQLVKILVKPSLLFRPVLYSGPLIPDPEASFLLYDRVVAVKPAFGVPMGMRGTVIGVHPAPKEVDIIYDVVFDEEFIGGITLRCSPKQGYRVPAPALINLTHGERKEQGRLPQQATRPAWGHSKQPSPQKQMHKSPQAAASYNVLKARTQQHANSYSSLKGNIKQPFILMPQDIANSTPSNASSRTASNQQSQAGRQQPQSQLQHDDFVNIWKQLQTSLEPTDVERSCSPSMSAAMEAAKMIKPPTFPRSVELKSSQDKATRLHADAEDDEFLAAFQRLEASSSQTDGKAERANTNLNFNTNANTSTQDSSLQLKQMLKIGDAGTNGPSLAPPGAPSSPQTSRNYGRQVSLQELFDVAKQNQACEGSKPLSLSTSMPPSTQGASQPPQSSLSSSQAQQQQGGRQQPPSTTSWGSGSGYQPLLSTPHKPSVSPRPPVPTGPQHRGPMHPPQGNVSRNPVNELKALAQRHQLGNVIYDYQKSKGLYTASVIMSSGHRFEGTPCATKEEAAESAASTALLLLNPNSQAPLLGMPMGMPGQGPFFSQGSAFSPVRPRGMPPHLLPQPRGFGPRQQPFRPGFPPFMGGPGPGPRGMGMPPPHMGGFPPNAHFPPGAGQRPPGQFGPYGPQRNQGPQLRQQGPQPRPGQPFSQQRMPQQPGMQQQQQQQQQQQGGPGNQSQKKGAEPSFIPLQVQRKQKPITPRKTEHVDGNSTEHPPVDAPAEGLLIDLSDPDPLPPKPQVPSQPFGAVPDPSFLPSPQSEASPQPGGEPKKPSKRRSRVAANFSNLS